MTFASQSLGYTLPSFFFLFPFDICFSPADSPLLIPFPLLNDFKTPLQRVEYVYYCRQNLVLASLLEN